MKKLFAPFAVAALVSFTACGPGDQEPVIIEEPVVEQPAPAPMTEPMPLAPDTIMEPDTMMPATPDVTPADTV